MLKFKKTVQACDLVFAGNRFLKEETECFVSSQKIHVIPTVIDLERYTPKNYNDSRDGVTLGWIGSRATLPYLKAVMPALDDLSRRHSIVRLKIVCDRFLDSRHIPVIKKGWDEETEVEDVKSFDVGLMPLSDDVWSKGKCALKIIQCLAVGVPVVCSPVGANREVVKNGSSGFWVHTHEEWIDRLSTLIENPSLRQDMGISGRRTVAEEYSVQAIGERIAHLLWKLVGGMQESQ
jgi:glycosyltransferase involved in cell wall biosynthesis